MQSTLITMQGGTASAFLEGRGPPAAPPRHGDPPPWAGEGEAEKLPCCEDSALFFP